MIIPSVFATFKMLRYLLRRKEKLQWIIITGFAICLSFLEILTASTIVIFAQSLSNPDDVLKYFSYFNLKENIQPNFVPLYIALTCGALYLVKSIFSGIEVFYQNFSIQNMCYRFKNRLLRLYAKGDYSTLAKRNASFGLNVIESDVELIFSNGMLALAILISELMVFLWLLIMIIYMDPILALIILGISSLIGLFIVKVSLPRFYVWGKRLQKAYVLSAKHLLQFFHGFKEIILMGKEGEFIESYEKQSYQQAQIQALHTAANSLPRIIIEFFFVGIFVLAVSYFCLNNEIPYKMMGVLGGYLYAGLRLMPGLNRIIGQVNVFKSIIPSIERVYKEYTEIPPQRPMLDVPNFEFKKSIVIKNMSFNYPDNKNSAIKDINLEIKKGECIGISGETGSGKSTLLDAILGLIKPQEGGVLIDDQFSPNTANWQKKIGYVPQSIYLIDDTIRSNIAFGEKTESINLSNLSKAIEDAQLKGFLKNLPDGLNTIVGERGIRLSGGERQRISIARALYLKPEVLIFDEATSALDGNTEDELMKTIYNVKKNKTLIMIAHRLSTLEKCDRIVVMKKGQIDRITTYDQLNRKKLKKPI